MDNRLVMSFNFLGTKIRISFLFCVVLSIMLLQDRTLVALPLLSAVLVHELAHIVAMFILDNSPKEINLSPYGLEITGANNMSINNEIIVALVGPLVNLLVSVVFLLYYLVYLSTNELIWCVIWAIIGLFNLLPSYYLDGGTILFNVCLKFTSPQKSELVLKIASLTTSIILSLSGVYFIFINFNPSVLIIGLYFFILTIIKN